MKAKVEEIELQYSDGLKVVKQKLDYCLKSLEWTHSSNFVHNKPGIVARITDISTMIEIMADGPFKITGNYPAEWKAISVEDWNHNED